MGPLSALLGVTTNRCVLPCCASVAAETRPLPPRGRVSLQAVTGAAGPGTGEHFDDFEVFEVRSFVSRLLGEPPPTHTRNAPRTPIASSVNTPSTQHTAHTHERPPRPLGWSSPSRPLLAHCASRCCAAPVRTSRYPCLMHVTLPVSAHHAGRAAGVREHCVGRARVRYPLRAGDTDARSGTRTRVRVRARAAHPHPPRSAPRLPAGASRPSPPAHRRRALRYPRLFPSPPLSSSVCSNDRPSRVSPRGSEAWNRVERRHPPPQACRTPRVAAP